MNSYQPYTMQTLQICSFNTPNCEPTKYRAYLPPYFSGSTLVRTETQVKPVSSVQLEDFLGTANDKENIVIERYIVAKIETNVSRQISKITVKNEISFSQVNVKNI